MVMDYHLELVEKDRAIRNIILNNNIDKHALQV
jgi:hypothetical protein